MPSGGRTLVIGGGIAAGSPFALDQFLYVTNVTQPEAASFPGLRRAVNGNAIAAPGSQAAFGNRNTVIGENNSVVNTVQQDAVFIGQGITGGAGSTPTTVLLQVGNNLTTTAGTAYIAIGGGIADLGSSGTMKIGTGMAGLHNTAIGIGYGIALGGAFNGVQIGNSSSSAASGLNVLIIGNGAGASSNSVVAGNGTAGATANTIFVGNGTAITGGGSTNGIGVGHGLGGVGVNNAITIGNGSAYLAGYIVLGNNNFGAGGFTTNLLLGGAQTHTAATAVPAFGVELKNASGTDIAAGDLTIQGPRATGNAASGNIIFQTGLVGGTGATLQTSTTVLRLTNAQKVEIAQDVGLTFVNQTDGAGAAAGTLTNAPTAGDPAFWLPVIINGTPHFIPCWT